MMRANLKLTIDPELVQPEGSPFCLVAAVCEDECSVVFPYHRDHLVVSRAPDCVELGFEQIIHRRNDTNIEILACPDIDDYAIPRLIGILNTNQKLSYLIERLLSCREPYAHEIALCKMLQTFE